MRRQTKIVATLGPATDSPEQIRELISAGVDVVRLNFSHGSLSAHQERLSWVREAAKALQTTVGILADLQGPKIRIGCFEKGCVSLSVGQSFVLDTQSTRLGNLEGVALDYMDLIHDVKVGDRLLLDDGRLELRVLTIQEAQIHCEVLVGGVLSDHKGINRFGGGLSAPSLTAKDKEDLIHAVQLDVDYIAISFPRQAEDIQEARKLIHQAGGSQDIVAKIERAEAIAHLDELIRVSDAVMVARGDLGVEVGFASLPGIQKHIISRACALDKVVITATQMMESMIMNSIPTRAEVCDVANAVLDGTDAVMLSAETATGEYPVEVVKAMAEICVEAEKTLLPKKQLSPRLQSTWHRIDEAIAMASMFTAMHLSVRAIVSLTESGSTPLWMSRVAHAIPIYALTPHLKTLQRVNVYRSVYPVLFDLSSQTPQTLAMSAVMTLKELGVVQAGDRVLITKGEVLGLHGGTNSMNILQVPD